MIEDSQGLAVLALLTAAGEGLDLFDFVVIKGGRRRLAAFVGSIDRVGRERERVAAAPVREHRGEHLTVLVDVARSQPLAIKRSQELAHLRRRHLRGGPITERLHDPPGALPRATLERLTRLTRLTQQEAVVLDGRRLRPPDLRKPAEPVLRQRANGTQICCGASVRVGLVGQLSGVRFHRRDRRDVCGPLIERALRAPAAALTPTTGAIGLLPCETEPTLFLNPLAIGPDPVSPVGVPVRPALRSFADQDHQVRLLEPVDRRLDGTADFGLGSNFLRLGSRLFWVADWVANRP